MIHPTILDTWHALAPGLLAALIALLPSVITALTAYPTARGWITWIQIGIDYLSVLQHRDSPGTLSLPLRRSASPTPRLL
jgi:hypothetical protein